MLSFNYQDTDAIVLFVDMNEINITIPKKYVHFFNIAFI